LPGFIAKKGKNFLDGWMKGGLMGKAVGDAATNPVKAMSGGEGSSKGKSFLSKWAAPLIGAGIGALSGGGWKGAIGGGLIGSGVGDLLNNRKSDQSWENMSSAFGSIGGVGDTFEGATNPIEFMLGRSGSKVGGALGRIGSAPSSAFDHGSKWIAPPSNF
jgi:hypothetical protein